MIAPEYCRLMARYNAWQNRQIEKALQPLPLAELWRDHGARFGSILGTLNHLLWADRLWMSRLDAGFPRPEGGIAQSRELFPTLGTWSAERFRMDARIRRWADGVRALELAGRLDFHSEALGGELRRTTAQCVAHMFNHQTHHRGQVHVMMTRAGLAAPVSDLILMPGSEEEE